MTPYDLWLCYALGSGSGTVRALYEAMNREPIFAEILYHMNPEKRQRLLETALSDAGKSVRSDPEKRMKEAMTRDPDELYEKMVSRGIHAISLADPGYPRRLRMIPDPPFFLFYIGRLPVDDRPSCAIVGSRQFTAYGKEMAEYFAGNLGAAGIQVISGMASGIDGIAGRAALGAGGLSAAVLGSSVEFCYPKSNRDLYESLSQRGGILSEYPPGTEPVRGHFPARNRIISGLSDLVLVIEARKQSGTRITVDCALEQGREVYAVPGRVTDSTSSGCNELLRDGASPAIDARDLLETLLRTQVTDETLQIQKRQQERRNQTAKKERQADEAAPDERTRALMDSLQQKQKRLESLHRQKLAAMPKLDAALYGALDTSTPKSLTDVLEGVSGQLGRRISYSELAGCATLMSVRGEIRDIGFGKHIALR